MSELARAVLAVLLAVPLVPACAAPDSSEPGLAPLEPGLAPFGTAADALPAARVRIQGSGRTLEFDVRVAETPEDQARGLQGVEALPEGAGMLFVFEAERTGGFWMRDTLVPLDIAFLDAGGRVLAVAGMVPCPGDPCPITDPGVPHRAALETAAGALTGVDPGDVVTWEVLAGR